MQFEIKKKLMLTPFVALVWLLMGCTSEQSSNGCFEVALGPVKLGVPTRYMTPTTPRKSSNGNFIFAFDSTVSGVDCPVGCKELFVNISHGVIHTIEKRWNFLDPKFTGKTNGNYQVYLSRYDRGLANAITEILVPMDTAHPQDEFYVCATEDREINPTCRTTITTKIGLTAEIDISRKSLTKAREARAFVTKSIDQF